MSLFRHGTQLVRQLWPAAIAAKLAGGDGEDDEGGDAESLPVWCVVPESHDEMCEWAIVMPDERTKGNSILLYSPDISPLEDTLKVSLVLHGVVEAVNLEPLGNWNGRRETTQRAVQYVTLGPGSWPEIFGYQVNGLKVIKGFVSSVLRDEIGDYALSPDTTIYCHRPVFSKVSSSSSFRGSVIECIREATVNGKRVKSVLELGDDPQGRARAVESMWVVGHRVLTGIRVGNETLRRRPEVIRIGDFVEVAASVDIVRQRKNKNWERKMRLTVNEVVKTHSAIDLKAMAESHELEEGEVVDESDEDAGGPKTMSVFGLAKSGRKKDEEFELSDWNWSDDE